MSRSTTTTCIGRRGMPPSPTVQIRGKFLYNCFSDSVPKPSKNSGRRFFDVFRRHLWRESPLGVSRHLRESHSHHQVCQSGEGTTRGWRMFCVFLVFLRSFRMIKGDDGELFFFFFCWGYRETNQNASVPRASWGVTLLLNYCSCMNQKRWIRESHYVVCSFAKIML